MSVAKESSALRAGCWRGTAAARRHLAFWNASCAEAVLSNVLAPPFRRSFKGFKTCAQLGKKRWYKFTIPRKCCSCLMSLGGGQFSISAALLPKSYVQGFPEKELQKHIYPNWWRGHWRQSCEKSLQMAEVCLPVQRTDMWVVHICKHTFQTICGAVHHSLNCLCDIGQPKRGEQILKQAKWC